MTPASVADRSFDHLCPGCRDAVKSVIQEVNAWTAVHLPGYQAAIAEGFRTQARQRWLYAQGRTRPGEIVTQKDGVTNPSNHQSCMAADVAFLHNGNLTWDVPDDAWKYLQHCAHEHGLTSGSDWATFKDKPHLEWPTTDKAAYAAAREWKAAQGLV